MRTTRSATLAQLTQQDELEALVSRASAEAYIDQTQSMRDAALSTVAKALADVQILSKNDMKMSKSG